MRSGALGGGQDGGKPSEGLADQRTAALVCPSVRPSVYNYTHTSGYTRNLTFGFQIVK